MSVRRTLAGALSVAVTGSVLVLSAGAAHAATDPDDTTFTPVGSDVIGVGSDTSQHAVFLLANAYNATTPTPTNRFATFSATGGGTIALPSGAINRPNGSGAGKTLLYNPSNPDIDFARSSSAQSTAETSAGLQSFPFALDTLQMAVSGQQPSHAPANLTIAQVLSIYKGDVTNWNQIGGAAGTIKPLIPQAGSGTLSFFTAQLTAANGGVAPTYAASVTSVQEHDPAPIQNDPDAVAPFSVGRANLATAAGNKLRLETGFRANRALYDVVRGADVGNADIQKIFGEAGFVCSDAARASIEAAGFQQLARSSANGVCGQPTQTATSNFTLNASPDDPTFAPSSTDLIGVGSDTSQHAISVVADAYNTTSPAPADRVASFAATGGGSITLPSGQITRPNGSGAGKTLLYNPSNPDIDFARASSSESTAEVSAGLQSFPFALDTLGTAVSGTVASNAPASLSIAQILSIYKGDVTTWSQVGGTSTATIKPLIPQAGSGTRAFFLAQLAAANGGTAPTLAASVTEVQENEPGPVQNDPNAIAPYSVGRAGLSGSALRVVPGFRADRALYDVVRGSDVGNADVQAFFGSDGYLCSDAATSLIEAAGFKQLARPGTDGVCGSVTQNPTTNFTVNQKAVATTTSLAATSPAVGAVHLVAKVSAASGAPTGSVTFTEGSTTVGTADLVSDTATATVDLSSVPAGSHAYTATYAPAAGSTFSGSAGSGSVTVASASISTTTTVTATSTRPRVVSFVAGVTASTGTATGTVTFTDGPTTIGTATLTNGRATLTKTGATPGLRTYTATYNPTAGSTFTTSRAVVSRRVKTTSSLKESFPSSVAKKKTAKGVVTVTLAGTATKATGNVVIKKGSKILASHGLSGGKVTLSVAYSKLAKGKNKLTILWAGDNNATGSSKSFTITRK